MVNRLLFILLMFIMILPFIMEAAVKLLVIMPVWWLITGNKLEEQLFTGDFLIWCENKLIEK